MKIKTVLKEDEAQLTLTSTELTWLTTLLNCVIHGDELSGWKKEALKLWDLLSTVKQEGCRMQKTTEESEEDNYQFLTKEYSQPSDDISPSFQLKPDPHYGVVTLEWEDGYKRNFPVGAVLRGVTHNNERYKTYNLTMNPAIWDELSVVEANALVRWLDHVKSGQAR